MAERQRLRELAVEALTALLAAQRAAGAVEAALQTGLRLVALDPLQEPVHRTVMRLYAQLGRRRGPGPERRWGSLWQAGRGQATMTGAIDSRSQRASDVILVSSCCCPITWRPTGRPPTLISGTVTAGANSIELGALKTKSPVGRGTSG